ncbi:MAG: NAD(P)-dependent oxidoreductase [Salinirussus sp.]
MTDIGFIGVGDMGGPISRHLVTAGHDVTAYDLDEDALADVAETGAIRGETARDAAAGAEIIFLCLPGPAEVEAVVEDIENTLETGALLVDLSTSRPALTDALADRLSKGGVEVLGAPISGGTHCAAAGTLTVMVGGDRAAFEAAEPVFANFAADRYHVGDRPGHGHATKLLNNYLSYTALVATSEAVILGTVAGLDPSQLVDIFSVSTGRNSATEHKFPNLILEGKETGFPLKLTEKDTRLLTEFARDQDVPLLLGHITHHLIGYARRHEGDTADMTDVYEFLRSVMAG